MTYYRRLKKRFDMPKLATVGTLVHSGLEAYYNGQTHEPGDLLAHVADEITRLMSENPEHSEMLSEAGALSAIMLEGYVDWAETKGIDHGLEIIGAEQMVEVVLSDGGGVPAESLVLRGKLDARVRRESDGALLQLEHKTVGNLSDHPKWAQENPQFLTYDLLAFLHAIQSGEPDVKTDGVIVNMLRRVKRTPRAKPPFYGRIEVRHNMEELRSHYKHVMGIAQQISTATKLLDEGIDHHLVVPPAPSRNHLWSCDCADVGSMFDDGSDVEAYLAEAYETWDPLERYGDAGGEEEEIA